MILFHNRVVDRLVGEGVPARDLFAQARRSVTWHYHWIIVNEFLPQIIGPDAVRSILTGGRRWYRPEPGPAFIPVEFQGAAYRFGHSMVRPSYRANLAGNADGSPFFGFIFDSAAEGQADPEDLRGGRRAPRRFMPQRNLLRHLTWELPAGQLIAQRLGAPMLHLPELSHYGVALENQTPLWYYVMAEAEDLADGLHLGPVGGTIVGEVFIGLLQLDPAPT